MLNALSFATKHSLFENVSVRAILLVVRIYGDRLLSKMAIPFSLPSDDATLEQYRSIHQLLIDLTAILRALMARNPEWIRPNNMPNANNENVAPASPACAPSPAGLQNAAAPPQFVFPLSPPNSQPGSPSPFFSATANGTAFALPDVIANAAATIPQHNVRATTAPASATFAPTVSVRTPGATAGIAMPGAGPVVLDAASIREKLLRKRKRAKLTKRKKLATGAGEAYEAQRKVARTGATACACAARCGQEMDPMMVDEDDDDDDSMANPADRIRPEYSLRSCHNATSAAGTSTANHGCNSLPTVHTNSCCLHQHQPGAASSLSHPLHSASDCSRVPVCMHVGEELRKIVECFRNPKELADNMSSEDMENSKGAGFMSQFGRTMFTAALLVIGWKLLRV